MFIPELSVKKAAIKEILAKDSIAEAIKQLKQLLPPTSSKLEDLILIEARQNETNRNRLRGVLDDKELQLTYNRIREDLLALIDSLQPSDFDPSQARSQIASSKKARRGHVLHRIPNKMRHLEETRCVVRIALDDSTIIENIDLDEHVQLQSVRISDLMQVELLDPADEPAFAIRSINTPEQFIDEDEYTEWQFFVKPLRTGTFPLLLKVAVIELVYGKERQREIVLEQAVDIVNVPTQEQVEFQSTGQLFDFSASEAIGAEVGPSDTEGYPTSTPPNLNPLRGAFARRAALSLATLMSCVGGAWAVTPTQVKWKAEVEWVATRYLLDNQSAYERYIRRHDQSQHYEMAVWQKTEIVDEPEAYVEYLEKFPEAEAAREDWELPKLERKIYEVVSNSPDSTSLRLYLKAFPAGTHRDRVEMKLDSVKRYAASQIAPAMGTFDSTATVSSDLPDKENKADPPSDQPATHTPDPAGSTTKLSDTKKATGVETLPPIESDKEQPVKERPPAATSTFTGIYGTTKDRQGNTYRTLPLNGLTWMADNLNLEVDKSWCYDTLAKNCATYGRLYTWQSAQQACKTLGKGWRLPTDKEWRSMAKQFGGADVDASDDGKAAYQALIAGGNSGFSAQLGGHRYSHGDFYGLGNGGYYWSATEIDSDDVWLYRFHRNLGELHRNGYNEAWVFSCRCVQD